MSGIMKRDDFVTDPFLKKPEVPKDPVQKKKFLDRLKYAAGLVLQQKVIVPPIYIWEDKDEGLIIGSVKTKLGIYGEAFPYEDNFVRRGMDKKKLFWRMREIADVLCHYGKDALDNQGEIDARKVRDQEALHWKHDPLWGRKMAAFTKACVFKEISKAEAKRLELI